MPGIGLIKKHLKKQKILTNFQANSIMQKLIKYFAEKQKTLFLIDSIGALITAFSLFVVMRTFNAYFGMPEKELTYLSIIAVCFGIYSAFCFLFLKRELSPFIKLIGFANLFYCALTFGLIIKHYSSLTLMGIAYFLIEIIIIWALSYVELNVAKEINKSR